MANGKTKAAKATTEEKVVKLATGAAAGTAKAVIIKRPNIVTAKVTIRSLSPYLQNRFSSENREKMEQKQMEGSSQKRTRKAKPPKDFQKVYEGSMHISREGWYGIPCSGIRQAMIDACRLTEFDMIRAKMCVDVLPDGLDRENAEPLTRITKGEPVMHKDRVRIGMNQTDIVARAMFEQWEAVVTLEWDNDVFIANDVINLLARAGLQVGIGAGRKLSKTSGGTGKGKFEVLA
jgi:hypothetical protein